jgi:quercetin dioxygenase-like cupin family protein
MKVARLKPAFRDRRGAITDILTHVSVDAVTIITCRKGSKRGNHFHKKTIQYTYIVSGRMKYLTRPSGGKLRSRIVGPGCLVESPAKENHAFVALTDSVILSLSSGPRRGFDFEKDTFRLERPLA